MEYVSRGNWRYVKLLCNKCNQPFERRIDRHNATANKECCGSCAMSISATASNTKHGLYGSPTYVSWQKMKDRCLNQNHRYFHLYGGRGIAIDPKWMEFVGFLEDMGKMPQPGFSIDRINNDDGYYKGNCRWIPRNDQQKNRRVCKTAYKPEA
jgi:hypothetical protein